MRKKMTKMSNLIAQDRPYGAVARRAARHARQLAWDFRAGHRFGLRVVAANYVGRHRKPPSLQERLAEKMLELVVRVICLLIERNMWKRATALDVKVGLTEWLETLHADGAALCRRAA
jgi:hypothetical protein